MDKIIIEKLREIERIENVKIIGAFESGSRAWGFASSDSDYDVRFIYVRKKEEYLKLEGIRDVIEYPINDLLDINGWDIQKALKLFFKTNPTIFEWCSSPITYIETDLLDQFKLLLPKYFSFKRSLHHYLSMASTNFKTHLNSENINLKKYFYTLRPLLAALWIINKKTQAPMLFEELVESELDISLKQVVLEMLQIKKEQAEIYNIPKVEALNDYIEEKLEYVKSVALNIKEDKEISWDLLNEYFLEVIEKS